MAGPRRKDRKTVRDLFPKDLWVQHLKSSDKQGAIGELVNALAIHGVMDISREASLREAMLQREQVASTGIGNGLAIPHTKSKFAEKFGVAVGLSDVGIDFGAHDEQPAHVVVCWICPPSATQEHLALMRALATVAKEPDQTARLARSRDRRSFLAVMEQVPVEPKGK